MAKISKYATKMNIEKKPIPNLIHSSSKWLYRITRSYQMACTGGLFCMDGLVENPSRQKKLLISGIGWIPKK